MPIKLNREQGSKEKQNRVVKISVVKQREVKSGIAQSGIVS